MTTKQRTLVSSISFFVLVGMAIAIPSSKFLMSLFTFLLFLIPIISGEINTIVRRAIKNKVLFFIFLFFLIHIISLLWSDNIDYGLDDLRKKLPLALLPLSISLLQITERQVKSILLFFATTTFVLSIINFISFSVNPLSDIREMSLFISHVRFSLFVVFSISIFIFYIPKYRFLFIPVLWLLFYLFYSQVLSGFIALFFLIYVMVVFYTKERKRIFFVLTSIFLLIPVLFGIWLFEPIDMNYKNYQLYEKTKQGNLYTHDFKYYSPIAGEPIYINLCDKEIREAWGKRSNIPITGKDGLGQPVRETLIRYLTAKGYPKDAEGVYRLTNEDIKNIEKGKTNDKEGLIARLYGLKFEVINHSNPNGHSLLQRLEYWKTGVKIVLSHPFLGVGVGDVEDVFQQEYKNNNTLLLPENRHRAHNYFLTIWISFGLIGVIVFILIFYYSIQEAWKNDSFLYVAFLVVVLSSFLTEDTLETQAGVTFFSFFITLFSSTLNKKER